MNEEQHIIKFECSNYLGSTFLHNDIDIHLCKLHRNIVSVFCINIHYNNLNIYNFNIKIDFDYIFNLSNMLYKIHNPNYYRRYNHKELI